MDNRRNFEFIEIDGKVYFKKTFQDSVIGHDFFNNEKISNEVFKDCTWFTPWVDSGDLWYMTEAYPTSSMVVNCFTPEILVKIMEVLLEIYSLGYAHMDIHCKNLFYVDGQIKVVDFETLGKYGESKPPFEKSYDLIGEGMVTSILTNRMCYKRKYEWAIEQVTKIPLEEALARLQKHLYQLLCAEYNFYTRTKKEEHPYKYPYLQIESLGQYKTQRDIYKRVKELGITEDSIRGKNIIDLGCNCGAFLFNFTNFSPKSMLGIEYHASKVRLARLIAAYSNVEAKFAQGDLENYQNEKQYDTVLCLAIVGHLHKTEHFYKMLYNITREVIYFEGNENVKKEKIEQDLRKVGFNNIEFRGYSTDDMCRRPLFICRK